MTSARKTWWYAVGQEKIGPCSSSELMDLVAQGKVFPDTLVWKEGMPNWVPASRIKGLWQNLPATPPAVPPLPASTPSVGASLPPIPPAMPQQQFGGFTPPPAPQASAWPDEEEDSEEELPTREEMTFKKAVERCFKKYFDFSGRAGRAEYWYFFLFSFIISLVTWEILDFIGDKQSAAYKIIRIPSILLIIPSLSATARRLHDFNRSGWWILPLFIANLIIVSIIIFYVFAMMFSREDFSKGMLYFLSFLFLILNLSFQLWLTKKGDEGENKYGYPE